MLELKAAGLLSPLTVKASSVLVGRLTFRGITCDEVELSWTQTWTGICFLSTFPSNKQELEISFHISQMENGVNPAGPRAARQSAAELTFLPPCR